MTLPSFLKSTNMKHLLKALSNTHRTNPSPFYLLKINKTPSIIPHPDFLSLNRTLSNAAIQAHTQRFSVWSPQHLQRLQESGIDGLQNKVLVSNPFKSEEFITQIFASSIKAMVISSAEEYEKIEKVKNSHFRFRNKPVDYYWAYSDEPEELENLKQLKEVIRNVVFDWSQIKSAPRIDHLTQKIIKLGCSLDSVVCSGTKGQMDELKRWSLLNLQQRNKKLLKQIEVRDVSDADSYILAARSRGRGTAGIHQAAQELVDISKCGKESLMVQLEKEEWLLSKICKFPLEEQPYLYEMNIKPENTEFQIKQASII